jgi:hypothetical protein
MDNGWVYQGESREVWILVVERLLLKKKKKYNGGGRRMGHPWGGIGRRVPGIMTAYKTCRASASMTPFNPPW